MAFPSHLLVLSVLLVLLEAGASSYAPMTLTIFNNCPFTIWPAILPNNGFQVLQDGGFELPSLTYLSFPAPPGPWAGRMWARTACQGDAGGSLSCETGDCGGRFACGGLGGAVPATLAQLSLHAGGDGVDKADYGVSLVDGSNLPLTVTPHEGRGRCPVVGCRADLLPGCPAALQQRSGSGQVVGCKSGCVALGTNDLCCRNAYSSPAMCRPSGYSLYFKQACPATYTYPLDTPSLLPDCYAPSELKLIFCQ